MELAQKENKSLDEKQMERWNVDKSPGGRFKHGCARLSCPDAAVFVHVGVFMCLNV